MPSDLSPAPPVAEASVSFGPYRLDFHAGRLLVDGRPVELAPRPFELLAYLARRPGKLVGKDELLDAVWGHRHVSDSALKVAVNALRTALGDDPKAPTWLETVPRRGYRFSAAVVACSPAPAAARVVPLPALMPAPAPAPVPAAPSAAPGNLPPPEPGLIGREHELTRLQAMLSTRRLVTLLGPGGVGKTRLALAAAAQAAPEDGVWLVRLDALADAEPLVATLARTLGLAQEAARSPETLARALAPLSLRLLLDNAEHLVDAVADLVARLLAAAPGLSVLVTSQHPLRLAGEQRMPLAPLALPPPDPAGDLETYAAAALLLARVRALQPDVALDVEGARAASRICHALDGLPLALELAAARVPLLGWVGVQQRLGERLSLLNQGRRDAAARHRTLRAALDWTCALLDPAEQRCLQRLSVFAGSFSAEAAEAVAADAELGAAQVLDALQGLRDKSLLVALPGAGAPRLRLYDSVRAHAAEQLQTSGRAQQAAARHLRWMLSMLAAADARFLATPLLDWLAPLRPEVDNLRAALRFALAEAEHRLDAVALFSHSVQFWVRGGLVHEGLRWFQEIQAAMAGPLPEPLATRFELAQAVLGVSGWMLLPDAALQSASKAVPALLALGDTRRAYLALYLQSMAMLRLRLSDDREPLLAQMRALEAPDWSRRERRLSGWVAAFIARDRGDMQAYHDFCVDHTAHSRALGDRHEAWLASYALAQALHHAGQTGAATELLCRTVDDLRQAGALREHATTVALAASLRLQAGADDATVACAREAVQLLQSDGMLWWMADALAWLPLWQGRWSDAMRVQGWADGLVRQRNEPRGRIFGGMREAFAQRMQAWPEQADCASLLAAGERLDEAGALRLAFGGTQGR